MAKDVEECFRGKNMEPLGVEKVIDGYGGLLSVDKECNLMATLHWEHRFKHMVKRYNEFC